MPVQTQSTLGLKFFFFFKYILTKSGDILSKSGDILSKSGDILNKSSDSADIPAEDISKKMKCLQE